MHARCSASSCAAASVAQVRWGEGCPKVNKLAIDRFRFGLQWCLAKAVELDLDISITPHLDDGLEMGGWRNALVFDPLAKYAGYSYYDVVLRPIASALNAVITPDARCGWPRAPGQRTRGQRAPTAARGAAAGPRRALTP